MPSPHVFCELVVFQLLMSQDNQAVIGRGAITVRIGKPDWLVSGNVRTQGWSKPLPINTLNIVIHVFIFVPVWASSTTLNVTM